MSARRYWFAAVVAAISVWSTAIAAAQAPPGGPGAPALWTEGDKDGFGTSTTLASKVWHTLDDGELTEVYYPDLGTPAARDLQFVVTDGRTFAHREREDMRHRTSLIARDSLSHRQVNTDRAGRYRITKTYTTDPARSVVLLRVRFESRKPLQLYALYDPGLSNAGDDDTGASAGGALLASDAKAASALTASPGFTATSSGYLGASDGWTDLASDFRMDWRYAAAPAGNVVQTARTALDGRRRQEMTVALGFAPDRDRALATARTSLHAGFDAADRRYRAGWREYLDDLPRPRSARGHERLYDVSLMVMEALEDKTYRGAGIASPSMAWVWGQIEGYSGPYHLVWSRDLYQVATAQIAAGDRAAAGRALDHLWNLQQQPDGCFPQNANLDGTPHWPNLQLDEVADPILLAAQLGRSDAQTWGHVRRAAECIITRGPASQERWENAEGYSPATIGAEIAGLICAADIAERNGAADDAARYRAIADDWRARLRAWTVTQTGPLSDAPYFLRLSVDGNANAGTTYTIGDGGPTIDQRAVVDTSFLELVRLGVLRADDPDVRSTLPVVDRELGVHTPRGQFWHRYSHDGYGETPDGGPFPGPGNTGRAWPIFAGERGEYELAYGELTGTPARWSAARRLDAIAATANEGLMLPEQVWDDRPPSGSPGFVPGTGTGSATPLGWTHAQFVRLAWSIDAGRPVERPPSVSCRYGGPCR